MKTYRADLAAKPSYDLQQHLLSLNEFFAAQSQSNIGEIIEKGYWNDHDYAVYFRFEILERSFHPMKVSRALLRALLLVLGGEETMDEIGPGGLGYKIWRLPFRG